jgi:hypothetical protein
MTAWSGFPDGYSPFLVCMAGHARALVWRGAAYEFSDGHVDACGMSQVMVVHSYTYRYESTGYTDYLR